MIDEPTVHLGDALAWLASLPTAHADAIITDPPYSSGGMTRGDRTASTLVKYTGLKRDHHSPGFAGDTRDGRGWAYWMALWLSEALRVTRPGGVIALFTDWRQLPGACDALQSGGWVWRGILPWIKPDARPQLGRYRQNAEFIVWGTRGPREMVGEALPGYHIARAPRANEGRVHITQKPLDVVRALVRIAPPGGLVVDPFAGSATTLVAALAEGRRAIGCEIDPANHTLGLGRLAAARGEATADQLTLQHTLNEETPA
jgi:site-specific DNA-methyltransferase (adenine-specific)